MGLGMDMWYNLDKKINLIMVTWEKVFVYLKKKKKTDIMKR